MQVNKPFDLQAAMLDDAQTAALPSAAALSDIGRLVAESDRLSAAIETHEAKLKELRAALKEVEEKQLPDTLLAAGVVQFTLTDGRNLSVTTEYHANISKDRAPDAFKWLRENGEGGVIKRAMLVPLARLLEDEPAPEEAEAARVLTDMGFPPQFSEDVHGQTLKALVRRHCEGENADEFPRELFGVYDRRVAVLKGQPKTK